VKIVADDKIPFLKGALEPFAEMVYLPGKEINNDNIRDADALLIRTRTKCSESLLRGTNVKFIGTATIGFDHIDTRYCESNNIYWTNAPGCNSSSVQQYITTALLSISSDFSFPLKNKTLGIIGVGNVGSKVAGSAKIMGMNVLLNDPPRARREGSKEFVDMETILGESDIITLHIPLTMNGENSTYHLFDESTFRGMKKDSWFFNSSRGEVTETAALKKALKLSHLKGAVIDVWENEPEIDPDLLSEVRIATPHIAGYSADGKANGTAMVVNSLCSYFELPLNEWYPDTVPQPVFPEIVIDGKGKTDEDIIRKAVLATYNIKDDDDRLRKSPSGFEKQRSDYPLRREFPSYSVELTNASGDACVAIKLLGFKVIV
jgi:erythronate-4-phosphate dehydrogenase